MYVQYETYYTTRRLRNIVNMKSVESRNQFSISVQYVYVNDHNTITRFL